VEEAKRVARGYTGSERGGLDRAWREWSPLVFALMGAAVIGLAWLLVTLM